MGYSSKAIVKSVKGGLVKGDVSITFRPENRPEDPSYFTRRFQSGSKELKLLEIYRDSKAVGGFHGNNKKIPVTYNRKWKIDYDAIEDELCS